MSDRGAWRDAELLLGLQARLCILRAARLTPDHPECENVFQIWLQAKQHEDFARQVHEQLLAGVGIGPEEKTEDK